MKSNHNVISKFNEKPKNKSSWQVLWFGAAALVVSPIIGAISTFIRRLLDPVSFNQSAGNISGGLLGVIIAFGLVIITVILFVKKYKLGERSWVLWVGFITACLVGIFWILFIAGELLFPH